MIEVASGNILTGVRYHVGNVNQAGTGTIVYNSVTYQIGGSFLGVSGVTTYTATLTAKVYADDTALTVKAQETADMNDEMSPYPENLIIHNQATAENFSETDAVYPEILGIYLQVTAEGFSGKKSQIINRRI